MERKRLIINLDELEPIPKESYKDGEVGLCGLAVSSRNKELGPPLSDEEMEEFRRQLKEAGLAVF